MLLRHRILRQAGKIFRHHPLASVFSLAAAVCILFYYYLLPVFIGEYLLPGMWKKHDIGHFECKVKRVTFRSLELQDIYFWNDFLEEGSINRGTIEYSFKPWSLDSIIELKSIKFYGFHGCASYSQGGFRLHGLNFQNLLKLSRYANFKNDTRRTDLREVHLKNSHIDLFFQNRRLHLPFTTEYTLLPSRKAYQLFGYIAPRGEYSIVTGNYFPDRNELTVKIKNEKINLGCFNDFLPAEFHKNNIMGRLASVWSFNTRLKILSAMTGEFMTGLPDDKTPNFLAGVTYQSDGPQGGTLKFQSRLHTREAVLTLSSSNMKITRKKPFITCSGNVHSEIFPHGPEKHGLFLPSGIALSNRLKGQISSYNFKWQLESTGEIEDGLTVLHRTLGRLGFSQVLYDMKLSGCPGGSSRFRGSLTIPTTEVKDGRNLCQIQNIRGILTRMDAGPLQLLLQSGNIDYHSMNYDLTADSWNSTFTIKSREYDFQMNGSLNNLQQRYQEHNIGCPRLCISLHKHPQLSAIHMNINSHEASLRSDVHGYLADNLQLNWNWLFNPDSHAAIPSGQNYLRCQCIRLPRSQTAALNLQCRQQNTTACWDGTIQLQSPRESHTINLKANVHWPIWKQLPFLAVHADLPTHVVRDFPPLQKMLPGFLYLPAESHDDILSVWLDGTWFDGKIQARTGFVPKKDDRKIYPPATARHIPAER